MTVCSAGARSRSPAGRSSLPYDGPSDCSSRLRTSATLEPPTCSPKTALASAVRLEHDPLALVLEAAADDEERGMRACPPLLDLVERSPRGGSPGLGDARQGRDLGRDLARLDRQPLAFGLECRLVPHERFAGAPASPPR